MIAIREAVPSDEPAVYNLGSRIPELRVSRHGPFMAPGELAAAIADERSTFLVAESSSGDVVGFLYATTDDADRRGAESQACLVYVAVEEAYRRDRVAWRLYSAALDDLRRRGVRSIYAWAHPTSGVINFLRRRGFSEGKACVWMDCEIAPAQASARAGTSTGEG